MRREPRGVPVVVAVALVIANFTVQFVPALAFLAASNLLLHLGVVVGLLGFLIGDAIG